MATKGTQTFTAVLQIYTYEFGVCRSRIQTSVHTNHMTLQHKQGMCVLTRDWLAALSACACSLGGGLCLCTPPSQSWLKMPCRFSTPSPNMTAVTCEKTLRVGCRRRAIEEQGVTCHFVVFLETLSSSLDAHNSCKSRPGCEDDVPPIYRLSKLDCSSNKLVQHTKNGGFGNVLWRAFR